jgi:glutamine synthetase
VADGKIDLLDLIGRGEINEVEVAWADHQGYPRGKRIPAEILKGRLEKGIAFADAALTWDYVGDVLDGCRLTGWETGYPDFFLIPDLDTAYRLPWRDNAAFVQGHLRDHHGEMIRTAPRSVLQRVIDRLAGHGYTAYVGAEIEFYLVDDDAVPQADGVQCYSLQKANELDPAFDQLLHGLNDFIEIEGSNIEYGPAQCEVNLNYHESMSAADQAFRMKYGIREVSRRHGKVATFMAKPYNILSGSSMHLHVSLWKDGEPCFAPVDGAESPLARQAIGGMMEHLAAITLPGAPTVNSYKRFEHGSFAPLTATWGRDNRTCAIRSLIESPKATRVELRTGAADANPYWAIAGMLAAVCAGIESGADPGEFQTGNLYNAGERLPTTLIEAVAAIRADAVIGEILGEDAVNDLCVISEAEWSAFITTVTKWDYERYLKIV